MRSPFLAPGGVVKPKDLLRYSARLSGKFTESFVDLARALRDVGFQISCKPMDINIPQLYLGNATYIGEEQIRWVAESVKKREWQEFKQHKK